MVEYRLFRSDVCVSAGGDREIAPSSAVHVVSRQTSFKRTPQVTGLSEKFYCRV